MSKPEDFKVGQKVVVTDTFYGGSFTEEGVVEDVKAESRQNSPLHGESCRITISGGTYTLQNGTWYDVVNWHYTIEPVVVSGL